MSEKVPVGQIVQGSISNGAGGMILLVLSGALLVRVGYDLGVSLSNKLLKQHDKDVRRMFKREKQIYKDQRKKEEREKREKEGRTGCFGWLKKLNLKSSREGT